MVNLKICALAIDAGGSYFKSALVDIYGKILSGSLFCTPVNSDGDAENVFWAYTETVNHAMSAAKENNAEIVGICIDTPGPFDYENGKSKMLHKFKAMYDLPIKPSLISAMGKDLPIKFIHDSAAFMLGELFNSPLSDIKNAAGVMLGTGLGFALVSDGKLLLAESGGPKVSIYASPLCGKTAEDFISRRGIISTYNRLCAETGKEPTQNIDVLDISILAKKNEVCAVKTFEITGSLLGKLLLPILTEYKTQALIFGGQISRSFDLMKSSLIEELLMIKSLKTVRASERIDNGHLLGASSALFKSLN